MISIESRQLSFFSTFIWTYYMLKQHLAPSGYLKLPFWPNKWPHDQPRLHVGYLVMICVWVGSDAQSKAVWVKRLTSLSDTLPRP